VKEIEKRNPPMVTKQEVLVFREVQVTSGVAGLRFKLRIFLRRQGAGHYRNTKKDWASSLRQVFGNDDKEGRKASEKKKKIVVTKKAISEKTTSKNPPAAVTYRGGVQKKKHVGAPPKGEFVACKRKEKKRRHWLVLSRRERLRRIRKRGEQRDVAKRMARVRRFGSFRSPRKM